MLISSISGRTGGYAVNKQEQVIAALNSLYNKIGWINKLKLAESYGDLSYTSSEISCIEYIGNHVDPNGTQLADYCNMTRSALSKMTKKLIKKGIIENYQRPDNKKEIYFRLTEKGKEIYNIHEEMTNKFMERDKTVFEQTPVSEIDSVLRFLENYSRHVDQEIQKMDVKDK